MPKFQKNNFMPLPLWLYIIGWIFFVYLFLQIIGFKAEDSNNLFVSGLYFIGFGVHEASHIIFSFAPPILAAAAGSIGEMSFSILILAATLKSKSYFASIFAGLWLMLSMNNVGRYMSDARRQLLPLIGPGNIVQHDWNYVFGQFGWLESDLMIGGIFRGVGDVIGFIGLIFGLWLIFMKIKSNIKNKSLKQSIKLVC